MANDWIKMRVWLRRDPKVIQMADRLAKDREFINELMQASCKDSAYEAVTPSVTRAICVAGLLEIWGMAREQGERSGDDLRVTRCNASVLNNVTDIPGIGEAMVYVGWAVEWKDSVIFPGYFAEKQSPEDRLKTSGAERQARYRAKLAASLKRNASDATSDAGGDVTSDVTSDVREEKRREEKRRKENTKTVAPLPDCLNTPKFIEAWADWKADRKERRKPLTKQAEKQQLATLEAMGHDRAIESIRTSIRQGWTGLFPPGGYRADSGGVDAKTQQRRGNEFAEPLLDLPVVKSGSG